MKKLWQQYLFAALGAILIAGCPVVPTEDSEQPNDPGRQASALPPGGSPQATVTPGPPAPTATTPPKAPTPTSTSTQPIGANFLQIDTTGGSLTPLPQGAQFIGAFSLTPFPTDTPTPTPVAAHTSVAPDVTPTAQPIPSDAPFIAPDPTTNPAGGFIQLGPSAP